MKWILVILILFGRLVAIRAQTAAPEPDIVEEQQLEDLAESTESETEDNYEEQQANYYSRHPLDINAAVEEFGDFPFLQPLEVENLIRYRTLLGEFISVYELQAVPGFTVSLVRKILPFVTIRSNSLSKTGFKEMWKGGQRSVLIRPSFAPRHSTGFGAGDTSASSAFLGSRLRLFTRYSYQFRDRLQYGFTGDQDAGEPFRIRKDQAGFDFSSFHLFIQKWGIIKSLALGDYTINLGQGLIYWQSQAFSKTSAVINIKREARIIRPYHSAGEFNFNRGFALTAGRGKWESTFFISLRRLSAHLEEDAEFGNVITSLLTSGYHRTATEIASKNIVRLSTLGGNMKWLFPNGHLGINAVHYHYSLPLLKRDEPYNLYAVRGNDWDNYSVDYSVTRRNFHFFGEEAFDHNHHHAFLNGVMTSLNNWLDLAVLHRFIEPQYQSLYGNAFTENTLPGNEKGLYCGVSWKFNSDLRLDLYADLFSFPWLKYREDSPGYGVQYLAQLNYKPNKKAELYSRVRYKARPLNRPATEYPLNIADDRTLANWRTNIIFQLSAILTVRTRFDFSWFSMVGQPYIQTGFLQYIDLIYKPEKKWYTSSLRFLVFETDNYDTRLYAYENDVPYSSSIPAFYGKGYRLCLNLKGNPPVHLFKRYAVQAAMKIARTLYTGNTLPEPGQTATSKPPGTDLKVQMLFRSGN